jgi:hypothetical protein
MAIVLGQHDYFDSRTLCHTWVEFVDSLRCLGFFSGFSCSPPSEKINIYNLYLDSVEEEATVGPLLILIDLFN